MPEVLEAEQARSLIEVAARGRVIARVHAPDSWYLKRGLTPKGARAALRGLVLSTARRRGKLILVDTERPGQPGRPSRPDDDSSGPTLGLHLGMSGRVIVDGRAAGDPLVYASNRDVPAWRRFGLRFADGGALWIRDPRRLGSVELDPCEDRLGPDATELSLTALRGALANRRAPLKAVLMDQSRVAGLGNLLTDEVLWRAGLDPVRSAGTLDARASARLHRAIVTTLRVLGRRGGSHTGDLMAARIPGGACPRDGAALLRRTVGGRTTYSCSAHQI